MTAVDSGAVRVEGGESMSVREQYEQKAEAMAQPIIDQFGFELVDVEYVKEAGNWYLRFYIDKEGGITVDDCEAVSRIFSDKLDELDFSDRTNDRRMRARQSLRSRAGARCGGGTARHVLRLAQLPDQRHFPRRGDVRRGKHPVLCHRRRHQLHALGKLRAL